LRTPVGSRSRSPRSRRWPRPSWGCGVLQSLKARGASPTWLRTNPACRFYGFPGIRFRARDEQVSDRRSSLRLPTPLQGAAPNHSAPCSSDNPPTRVGRSFGNNTAALLGFPALQRLRGTGSVWRGLPSPPGPARSVSTLSASCAIPNVLRRPKPPRPVQRPSCTPSRVYFAPTTLLSLPPSRLSAA